jgi:hypothetical protein
LRRLLQAEKDDVGIVLACLVVVDVDSVEQALALEARFPVLHEVPMENTRRGRHYFFLRTVSFNANHPAHPKPTPPKIQTRTQTLPPPKP